MAFSARIYVFLLAISVHLVLGRHCPCLNPNHCTTITQVRDTEVYLWAARPKMWKHYNWNKITTLALFTPWDSDLMCYAHSRGVRVVITASYPTEKLNNTKERTEWVHNVTQVAYNNFADGINLDIEGAIDKGSKEVDLLTDLVKETVDSFKKTIPGSQITLDAPPSPICYPGGRCYDYKALADALDFLIIMAYDETGYGVKVAGPNSPYDRTARYVEEYKKLDINTKKIVLALPWYGYDYTCIHHNFTNGTCFPNCSTTPCRQISYSAAQDLLVSRTDFGREWNPTSLSPYFWYKDEYGTVHQVWYDDVYSLRLKYRYALEYQEMRGVGVFHADELDYGGTERGNLQTSAMWRMLPSVPPAPVGEKEIVF